LVKRNDLRCEMDGLLLSERSVSIGLPPARVTTPIVVRAFSFGSAVTKIFFQNKKRRAARSAIRHWYAGPEP